MPKLLEPMMTDICRILSDGDIWNINAAFINSEVAPQESTISTGKKYIYMPVAFTLLSYYRTRQFSVEMEWLLGKH